jgi:hypothetical protein
MLVHVQQVERVIDRHLADRRGVGRRLARKEIPGRLDQRHLDLQVAGLDRRIPARGERRPAPAVVIGRGRRQPDFGTGRLDVARRGERRKEPLLDPRRPSPHPRPRDLHPLAAAGTAGSAHDQFLAIEEAPPGSRLAAAAAFLLGPPQPGFRLGHGLLHRAVELGIVRPVQLHPRARHFRPLRRQRLVAAFPERRKERLAPGFAEFPRHGIASRSS